MTASKTEVDQQPIDPEIIHIEKCADTPVSAGRTVDPDTDDSVSVRSEALGDNLPEGYYRSFKFVALVIGFGLTALSSNMFVLMPTNILTYINNDIGPSPYIAWVNIARTLSLAFAYTIFGRLSDLFGRRWFYIIGNCISLLGIIVSATAQNVNALIVGAAIAGLGETVQLSFNVALGELVPNKYRPLVTSTIFFMTGPFTTFGPTLARYFVRHPSLGWRYCFFINIAATSLAIILLYLFYHPPTFYLLHERKTKREILRNLDYVGMFLWTAGLTTFLMGISWGGVIYPWKSAGPISGIVIGVSLLVALFVYEIKMDLEYPAIPVKLFKNRGFISLVACATVASMFYYPALLLWPQQIARFFTTDITYAGWLSTTVASATVLGQACSGVIIRLGGNVYYMTVFSACMMTAFVVGLAGLTPERKSMGIAFTIIGPFFVGFIELASLAIAPLFCKASEIGLASGLLSSIRSAGSSISVAIFVAIYHNRLDTTLTSSVNSIASDVQIPSSMIPKIVAAVQAGTLAKVPGITASIQDAVNKVVIGAYIQSFKTVYLASLAFGGIAIIASLFTRDARQHLTNKVERRMHDRKMKINATVASEDKTEDEN